MSVYGAVLFLHMVGLTSLFGGFILLTHAGARLRASTRCDEARLCLQLLGRVAGMFIGGAVILVLTGAWMAALRWSMRAPWIVMALVVLAAMLPLGLVMTRALARIRHAVADHEGQMPATARRAAVARALWSSVFAMNGAAMGVVWLMTNKPGWAVSVGVPIALGIIGALAGSAVGRAGARRMARETLAGNATPGMSMR